MKKYRPCVGIALFNEKGQVFVGERVDTPGAWQMPQGGIDEGEDIAKAAFRELAEETGVVNADILEIATERIRYDVPTPLTENLWRGNYAGQEQSWVAMRFTGDESEINLSAHDPVEFSKWQWVDLAQTPELIVEFKREVYKKVATLFQEYTIG